MKRFITFLFLLLSISVFAQKKDQTITQVSTIDALLTGIYDGQVAIGELKNYGNFGIGTFNTLDGEMVVSDGKFYKIRSNGKIIESSDTDRTPFSTVSFFNKENKISLSHTVDFKSIGNIIDSIIPTKNIFYGIMIKGKFKNLKARSVASQIKPYKPLVEVVKSQAEFNFENVDGIVIGFRSPAYVKGLNVPGYHLHFLSDDKKSGGHVLSFQIEDGELYINNYPNFRMLLPGDEFFYKANLGNDMKEQLNKVEK